jgi:hypothetical protein
MMVGVAILSLEILSCAVPVSTAAGQCCAANLIDSRKLLTPNISTAPHGVMTVAIEYSAQPVDLGQFLRNPRDSSVLWTVDGVRLDGALLRLKSAPADDKVAIYRISAGRGGEAPRDEFSVVVFPRSTRERFSAWYRQERADLAWLALLPPVYSSLGPGLSDPEPSGCEKRYWEGIHKLDSHFHPGGAYEMRSRPVGDGFGHQAVYDSTGRLVMEGAGAGSADKGTPRFWAFGYLKHLNRDVRPFVWAAQLDGNPVNPAWLFQNFNAPLLIDGEHIRQYHSVRPALWGRMPQVAPGTCIAGR